MKWFLSSKNLRVRPHWAYSLERSFYIYKWQLSPAKFFFKRWKQKPNIMNNECIIAIKYVELEFYFFPCVLMIKTNHVKKLHCAFIHGFCWIESNATKMRRNFNFIGTRHFKRMMTKKPTIISTEGADMRCDCLQTDWVTRSITRMLW